MAYSWGGTISGGRGSSKALAGVRGTPGKSAPTPTAAPARTATPLPKGYYSSTGQYVVGSAGPTERTGGLMGNQQGTGNQSLEQQMYMEDRSRRASTSQEMLNILRQQAANASGAGAGGAGANISAPQRIDGAPGAVVGGPSSVSGMGQLDAAGKAAQSAVFGRAKERAGQVASSALRGLQSSLAARGMLGSGVETQGTVDAAMQGAGILADASREEAIQEAGRGERAREFETGAKLQQRGQDITVRGQDITQRGQDVGLLSSKASAAQSQYAQQQQQAAAMQNAVLEALRSQMY